MIENIFFTTNRLKKMPCFSMVYESDLILNIFKFYTIYSYSKTK